MRKIGNVAVASRLGSKVPPINPSRAPKLRALLVRAAMSTPPPPPPQVPSEVPMYHPPGMPGMMPPGHPDLIGGDAAPGSSSHESQSERAKRALAEAKQEVSMIFPQLLGARTRGAFNEVRLAASRR